MLATLLSLALALAGVSAASVQAFADEAQGAGASALRALSSSSVTASGTCGTVIWTLYGDGELVLAPTSGDEGTLESFSGAQNGAPWFDYNESITSVDVTGTVHAGESLGCMFYYCDSLASLDLLGLDTSSVTDMSGMFAACGSLASLDLSSFDTSSVTDMSGMFSCCESLTSLDLSSFDTSNVTTMASMFYWCESLTTIYVSELWSTESVTHSSIMFADCTSLVGGNGTAYSIDYVDIEYARIDADGEPGYFTYKAYEAYRVLYGSNRYKTMEAIVEEAFGETGSEYAVVATGTNYPDALAAASLAGALDAPVVLISPKTADDAAELLEDLGVSQAYVVGGTSAVSASEVAAIEAAGVSVQRVYGANRYDTALAIAWKVLGLTEEAGAASDTCLVATGAAFADALSASPYAYWSGSPIYLAGKDGSVSDEVLAAIEEAGYERIVVLGGTSAVSASGYKALAATGAEVERVSGANRYDTSAAMAQWSVDEGMSWDGAAVATGTTYPDALAGAALCGSEGSVLLLASDSRLQAVELLGQNAAAVTTVYILGGTNAVSATVRAAVSALL